MVNREENVNKIAYFLIFYEPLTIVKANKLFGDNILM